MCSRFCSGAQIYTLFTSVTGVALSIDAVAAADNIVSDGSYDFWLTVDVGSSHELIADLQSCHEKVPCRHKSSSVTGKSVLSAGPSSPRCGIRLLNAVEEGCMDFVSVPKLGPPTSRLPKVPAAGNRGKHQKPVILSSLPRNAYILPALLLILASMAMWRILG